MINYSSYILFNASSHSLQPLNKLFSILLEQVQIYIEQHILVNYNCTQKKRKEEKTFFYRPSLVEKDSFLVF